MEQQTKEESIILSALREQYERKLMEIRELQEIMQKHGALPSKKTVVKKDTLKERVKKCIECSATGLSSVEIGNVLGGTLIPKHDKETRGKHFQAIASTVNYLFNEGSVKRERVGGVYEYSKK